MEPQQAINALDRHLRAAVKAEPLAALSDIASLRQLLALREREAVNSALEDHTWRQIGEALGVSKQAVFQRFGKDWAAA